MVIVGKVLDFVAVFIREGYDGALVVSVVVEGAVLVGDAKRRVDALVVGDCGDDIVVAIEDGDDILAVVEILLRDAVFGFGYSSA